MGKGRITENELSDKLIERLDTMENNISNSVSPSHRHKWSDIDSITDSSTSAKGVVQLNDTINSTSTTQAATANAVKKAYDKAEAAFQSASDGKSKIATAITGKGITTSSTVSFDTMAANIDNIPTPSGTALASDVLSGKTFSNSTGTDISGTMRNNGNADNSILNGVLKEGYTEGGHILNLVHTNIKNGVNIAGIVGSLVASGFSNYAYIEEESSSISYPYPTVDNRSANAYILSCKTPTSFKPKIIIAVDNWKYRYWSVFISKDFATQLGLSKGVFVCSGCILVNTDQSGTFVEGDKLGVDEWTTMPVFVDEEYFDMHFFG